MSPLVFELDEAEHKRLRELAEAQRRTEAEICREAVSDYLRRRAPADPKPTAAEGYAALRELIGLVEDGPTDASVVHDYRPGDPL